MSLDHEVETELNNGILENHIDSSLHLLSQIIEVRLFLLEGKAPQAAKQVLFDNELSSLSLLNQHLHHIKLALV
ncbi:unnamed protein product [Moritella viscosa]|uniref:hypothetical protein n=1 Tax=Moritella viscosa TaxID=80854 RepID=UPI00091B8C0C|nr:hypothetical protein [Moritella viscosa]SHO23579.1 unnamed protein product [Moritella viscosa]